MKKIVLLGHGIGIKYVIDSLTTYKNGEFKVVAVFTHPFELHKEDLEMMETRKDIYGDCAYNVFNLNSDYGIPLFESADVNESETIDNIKKFEPDYIISIGCRNILKKDFLNNFERKVFNIHTAPLPEYRGAANDSWMILNGLWDTEQFGCAHFIDSGIDTGDIIAKSYYKIPNLAYPIDVFKTRMNTYKYLLPLSLDNLNKKDFKPEKQELQKSTFFPRLKTSIDGKIDFSKYSGIELLRFIYAFSYPYEGAHCFMENLKINILEAEFIEGKGFHTFTTGIIFGKDENKNYKVALKDGYLLIKKIEIDKKPFLQNKIFKLGKRLT